MNKRHGSPWDRGSADSYYRRGMNPHYYIGDSYYSKKVTAESMTNEEIEAYIAGFNYNEAEGNFKEYYE